MEGWGEAELHYAATRTSRGAWSPGTARTRFKREDSIAATAAVNLSDSRYGILSPQLLALLVSLETFEVMVVRPGPDQDRTVQDRLAQAAGELVWAAEVEHHSDLPTLQCF